MMGCIEFFGMRIPNSCNPRRGRTFGTTKKLVATSHAGASVFLLVGSQSPNRARPDGWIVEFDELTR